MNRRKVCVVTGTRAEYGILSQLLDKFRESDSVDLQIVVTNMHLSERYGMTVNEIENDGFEISYRIPLPLEDNSASGTVKAMAVAMEGFADAFETLYPDIILILGDRYEMLAAASAAAIFGIPVAHFHGGEITEGAYDDAIRHAITKLATYHFTATEEFRNRVIQMGEEPSRVFNIGSLAVDSILKEKFMDLDEFNSSLNEIAGKDHINLSEGFLLVTFHPVTKQPEDAEKQTEALLDALDNFPECQILFTMPNSDTGSRIVGEMINKWAKENSDRTICVKSLGRKRYYSALHHCRAVVGNSSSGLIEAPSFGIPTLNIGDRQRGRVQGNTVLNCEPEKNSITEALHKVLQPDFADFCKCTGTNPYAGSNATGEAFQHILTLPAQRHLPKHFQDLL